MIKVDKSNIPQLKKSKDIFSYTKKQSAWLIMANNYKNMLHCMRFYLVKLRYVILL